MAAYDYASGGFPTSPVTNDTLTINGTNYTYNGSAWEVVGGAAIGGVVNRYIQLVAVEKSTALVDGSDIVGVIEIPFSGTMTAIRAKTTTGTCTVTVKQGGVSVGTINATTSGVSTTVSSTITAFDDITFDVASASGTGLAITIIAQEV